MATNGNDNIFLEGFLQMIQQTETNVYSGKSYDLDDYYYVNNLTYDGLGGMDSLLMSEYGDYLTITNDVGVQLVKSIERFFAGNGGDFINLAHETITYGDVQIFGGEGNDILWANVGNDQIYGSGGNDIIDGGPGNDILQGNLGNDQIFGGAGNDTIDGGDGDDILFGGTDLGLRELDKSFLDNITFPSLQEGVNIVNLVPPGSASLGISADNLTVDFGATATVTFREGFAGYNNTLGIYAIAQDGTIQNADVLWANVKTAGLNTEHQIGLPVGTEGGQFGFFIIANGNSVNGGYSGLDITGDGNIRFVYDFGGAGERAAKVTDDGAMISIVYDDGSVIRELGGYHYHTTPRGETTNLNWDGDTHAVSGLLDASNQDVLRIGFEDLPNLGDADYEDVLFDLNINRVHVDASETGNDTLTGGAGNDILYGEAGNDILIVGSGFDQIYGGSGADIIRFTVADALVDKIFGFEAGVGGDVLDLSQVLDYDPMADVLSDFVHLVNNANGDTEIQINATGDANGVFVAIALFDGGINATMAQLVGDGNLVA